MHPLRKVLVGGAIAATALTGGAVGASLFGTAGAATTSSTSANSSATPTASSQPPAPNWSQAGHQANGKTETLLTGTDAAKAKAAAESAVPGATAQRTETDADGDTYEVHMTKSDGSIVTVKLDTNFTVTRIVNGMG